MCNYECVMDFLCVRTQKNRSAFAKYGKPERNRDKDRDRDRERYRKIQREREREREREKLFDIAYFLAKKGRPYSDFSELIILQKMHEVNLASVITTIKFAPNSLISSINQYLRSSLKVRFYCSYVMEVPILLLLRKKAFMSCSWVRIRSIQHFHFFI